MKEKKPRGPGRKFQPGVSGNPLGGKLHDPVKKEFKHLTEDQLREVLTMILRTHPSHIQDITANADTVLKAWVGNAAIAGMNNGDLGPLMMIVDRVLGGVPQTLTIKDDFERMTDEEILAEIGRLKAIAAGAGI